MSCSAATTSAPPRGDFSASRHDLAEGSDAEQLDDTPFLSRLLPPEHESFSEKFLRSILTSDYQNLMPRRREKFVEITKTVTVTEIVNGAGDKHPSSCEVRVTNVSPTGPHPVNVSIKHLHEKWRSCEELDSQGTVIRIEEKHHPVRMDSKCQEIHESRVEQETRRSKSSEKYETYFNKSSDNVIDLEFRHPVLIETSQKKNNGVEKREDLLKNGKRVSVTETTEMERITNRGSRKKKRSSSNGANWKSHQPVVQTLYYRKFIDTLNDRTSDSDSDSGSVIIREETPRKNKLGREESLHFYRDEEEVLGKSQRISSVSMNENTCTDTSFESNRFSTIPKENYIEVKVTGPVHHEKGELSDAEVIGRVGEDFTMDISLHPHQAPPKPPRRAKWQPLATSTPMTTIERHRPPNINITDCGEELRSPGRTPIVVVNQTPTSRRGSHDILGSTSNRRKSTVTDIDWYAAFNMKEASSPRTPGLNERRSVDIRRRASESSIVDFDLNQIFICSSEDPKDEKCQCNACRLIKMSESERKSRMKNRKEQSVDWKSHSDIRSTTLPSRYFTPPVIIDLDNVFNPPPVRPPRRSIVKSTISSELDETLSRNIDQSQVRAAKSSKNEEMVSTNREPEFNSHVSEFSNGGILEQSADIQTTVTMQITPRKMSVTRKISIDELNSSIERAEKSKSSKGVKLPASDVTLDAIFTALTPKVDAKQMFIVTRKQTAQDVEELPVVPPRKQKKTKEVPSLERILSKIAPPPIEVSDVSEDGRDTSELDVITHRIDEFKENISEETITHEMEVQVEMERQPKKDLNDEQRIEPSTQSTSTVTINLDDIFTESPEKPDQDQGRDKISDRIAEFNKNKAEKANKAEKNEIRPCSEVVNERSDISLDDVFDSNSKVSDVSEDGRDTSELDVITHRINEFKENISEETITHEMEVQVEKERQPKKDLNDEQRIEPSTQSTSTVTINLDDIFTESPEKPDQDQGRDKISDRIAEFNKNKAEKANKAEKNEIRPCSEVVNERSDISLDEVFDSNSKVSDVSEDGRDTTELDVITHRINEFKENISEETITHEMEVQGEKERQPKKDLNDEQRIEPSTQSTSTVTINLDDIFTESPEKPDQDQGRDKISDRIAEFNKNKAEKANKAEKNEIRPCSEVVNERSDISLDEVFDSSSKVSDVSEDGRDTTELDVITHRIDEFKENISEETITHEMEVQVEMERQPKKDLNDEQRIEPSTQSTSTVTINLDDIFTESPEKPDQDQGRDKISDRIAEFNKNKAEKANKAEKNEIRPCSEVVNERSDISLDDVFDSNSKVSDVSEDGRDTSELDVITHRINEFKENISEETITHEMEVQGEKERQPKKDLNDEQRIEPSTQSTSTVTINLDDIFTESPEKPDQDQGRDKISDRIAEFNKNKAEKANKAEKNEIRPCSEVVNERSDISLDDVFDSNSKVSDVSEDGRDTTELDVITHRINEFKENISEETITHEMEVQGEKERQPKKDLNDEQRIEPSTQSTSTVTINLDDIFTESPEKPDQDQGRDKISDRIAEFNKNKAEKANKAEKNEIRPCSEVVNERSDISLDEVFDSSSKVSDVSEDGRDTTELDVITHRINEFKENISEETITHEMEVQGEKERQPKKDLNDEQRIEPSTQSTSTVTINLDDIFTESPEKPDQDQGRDKISDRIAEFNKNKAEKANKAEKNEIRPCSEVVNERSDISLDDVFDSNSKVSDVSEDGRDTSELDVITHRINEFKENISEETITHEMEVQGEKERQPKKDLNDEQRIEPSTQSTSTVTINLDDIFTESPEKPDQDQGRDKISDRIAEFNKNKAEKANKAEKNEIRPCSEVVNERSDISLDDVFDSNSKVSDVSEDGRDTSELDVITHRINEFKENISEETITHEMEVQVEKERQPKKDLNDEQRIEPSTQSTSTVTINLDDIFTESPEKPDQDQGRDKISDRIAEFNKNKAEKANKAEKNEIRPCSEVVNERSDISLDEVFDSSSKVSDVSEDGRDTTELDVITHRINEFKENISEETITHEMEVQVEMERQPKKDLNDEQRIEPSTQSTSTVTINLDDIFTESPEKPDQDQGRDKISDRIAEFNKNKAEKANKAEKNEIRPCSEVVNERSDISLDDVFDSNSKVSDVSEDGRDTSELDVITHRINEFKENISEETITHEMEVQVEKERQPKKDLNDEQRIEPSTQSTSTVTINLDDIFTESPEKPDQDQGRDKISDRIAEFNKNKAEKANKAEKNEIRPCSEVVNERSDISLDDVFDSNSKVSDVSEDGRDTTELDVITHLINEFKENISEEIITHEMEVQVEKERQPKKDLNDEQRIEPSAQSTSTVTINLDDIFTESPEKPDQEIRAKKSRALGNLDFLSPATCQDTIRSTSTISIEEEDTKRNKFSITSDWIPKSPNKDATEYFPSPTRISSETKFEWVSDFIEKLDNPRGSWISTVTYTLQDESDEATTSHELEVTRENILKNSKKTEVHSDGKAEESDHLLERVFEENCKKQDTDEKCNCSACYYTKLSDEELEELKRKRRERQKVELIRNPMGSDSPRRSISEPCEFPIDDIFQPSSNINLDLGQQIYGQVEGVLSESPITTELHINTSATPPPITHQTTTQLSPTVSETVTTIHKWKEEDGSVFSPGSDRRFSSFYDDRNASGFDTVESEDSGVMSGGGRRSSRNDIVHIDIDEVLNGIYHKPIPIVNIEEAPYEDFYISSLREENSNTDNEVDGSNLDVSQFVDDILGKSLDEAAFLSSTKSYHRSSHHTDTSIDRRKNENEIRTNTSGRIQEDREDLMHLVFVDSEQQRCFHSTPETEIKPSDQEFLEIEIQNEYFVIKGSYSLVIPKSDPLGKVLEVIRAEQQSLATLDFSLTRKLKKLLMSCVMEKALGGKIPKVDGVSSRGNGLISSVDHASNTFLQMNENKFDPIHNPEGIVNFCTAENNICTPLLEDHFKHIELFFPNAEHLVRYPPSGGWPEARQALCSYFSRFLSANITDPSELVLTASTRTGYDVVCYSLFEECDVLLTNGPIYTGTLSNPNERSRCVVEVVATDLRRPRIEIARYQEHLTRLTKEDRVVGGVIIVNPHNPLGVVFPPGDVIELCNWAAANNLHVIIDEVFANCVFDTSSSFKSYLSYRHLLSHPEKVAYLWSVSKDFGLPGLKFAVIHTTNDALRQAATKLQFYHPCSPFVQDFATKLLSDFDWLQGFHAEVKRRIRIHHNYTVQNLQRLGIDTIRAEAGIFVFANFTPFMPEEKGEEGELILWRRLADSGVMLTPGVHQKSHESGWMRLVYACSREELEEGIRRLYRILSNTLHPIGNVQY